MEWQIIDTAPKDEYVFVSGYKFNKQDQGRFVCEAILHGGGWKDTEGGHLWFPTHWMPMPEPPEDDDV